jgi:hypothetical protein
MAGNLPGHRKRETVFDCIVNAEPNLCCHGAARLWAGGLKANFVQSIARCCNEEGLTGPLSMCTSRRIASVTHLLQRARKRETTTDVGKMNPWADWVAPSLAEPYGRSRAAPCPLPNGHGQHCGPWRCVKAGAFISHFTHPWAAGENSLAHGGNCARNSSATTCQPCSVMVPLPGRW